MITRGRYFKILLALGAVMIAAAFLSFCTGPSWLSPASLLDALFGNASDATALAISQLRIGRTTAAIIVGAGLAVSGALCQGVLRNPLADPYILGVSGGAGLAVVLAISLWGGMVGAGGFILGAPAVIGAAAAVGVVILVLSRYPRLGLEGVVLLGVMINSVCASAIVAIASFLGEGQLLTFYHWLLGSLSTQPYDSAMLAPAFILVVGLVAISLFDARKLNLLALSADEARALGVDVLHMRRYFLLLAAVLCAVSVALSGLVGFVGLVAPHIARRLWGTDARLLLPCSALLGGSLVAICDSIARVAVSPSELPVGVVCALIGAPTFIWILVARAARAKEEGA